MHPSAFDAWSINKMLSDGTICPGPVQQRMELSSRRVPLCQASSGYGNQTSNGAKVADCYSRCYLEALVHPLGREKQRDTWRGFPLIRTLPIFFSKTVTYNKNWLAVYGPLVKMSIKRAKAQAIQGVKSIRHYFGAR